MRVRDRVRMRFSNFQLVLSREGMWRDILSIPDLLLKWLFFGPFHASLVLFTWFIKEMILARMATVFSKAFANSSKAASSRQSLNHAMDFAFVKLFSVTYLGSYLVRKCKTQQSCRQTVKQLSPWQRFTHHTIMKFVITWSLFKSPEWNQRCVRRPEINWFQQKSRIIAIWSLYTRKEKSQFYSISHLNSNLKVPID